MQLGFIGAGRIGRPMIAQLVAAGHQVRVLDSSEAARTTVAETGAIPVADVAALADGVAAILLCPYSDGQVQEVCLEGSLIDEMPTGSLLVVHTTGSPSTIARIIERAEPCGIEVVDAPISGGPPNIEAGRVTLYVGATPAGLVLAQPILSAYGDPILHLGPPGSGQLVKLVNNAVFAANLGVLAEALRLAEKLGIEENTVLTGLRHGSGGSNALLGVASMGSLSAFARTVGEFVGKDVAVIRDVATEFGADLGLLAQVHRTLGELLFPEHRTQILGVAKAPQAEPPS